ncbi:zinc finger C2H2-type protein [Fadolivirus algeromassiliense]|jgi:hypothetical protein|uniref:Zinc finger C2H2-type protein n=1 Tax=Fadolivirus FV1/VV64 TaxID=3070911 RepID=A0A7D3V5U1_9VIRU|nr:zinc finger C2H2-type protein [Fadolivirus algeromassiliense]QKF94475.1 zinc finger C2H2-type protein [Fadolivirus FV1/VV64]
MGKFICSTCNYESDIKFNYEKHLNTKKHKEKVNQKTNHTNVVPIPYLSHTNNGGEKCNFCGKIYSNSSSLARHKNACSEKKEYEDKMRILEDKYSMEINHLKELLAKETKNSEDKVRMLESENRNLRILLNNAGNIVKTSVSTMSYIVKNYTEAPALESIKNIQALHYEMTSDEFVTRLLYEYRHETLISFIGDLLIKNYKKEDPKKQSIWNSDTSRLTYIIREIINNNNLDWKVDKKGIKTTKYIIEPVLKYISDKLIDYIKNSPIGTKDDSTNKIMEMMMNLKHAQEINKMIDDKVLEDELLKYIAPHLYLVKGDDLLVED